MKWYFEITEISNGAYKCVARRNTGNVVSMQCAEDEIYRIFKQTYEMEVELGTLPGKALFFIVSGARKNWIAEYNENAFGSWVVESSNSRGNFVYDGRDLCLMIHDSDGNTVWQAYVKDKGDAKDSIFHFLVLLSG